MIEDKKVAKRPFLENIHLFRAFAIVNVMMVHLWSMRGWDGGLAFANLLRAVIFGNSTIYFIFISGFLFEYLSHSFRIKTYYSKKIRYVFVPYALMSLLFTLTKFLKLYMQSNESISVSQIMWSYFNSILLGTAADQFWYIPFIVVVFALSPFLLKIPQKFDKVMVGVVLILPLLGTRTGTEITVFQYLYFFPIYILGFYVSKYYWKVEQKL